MAPQIVSITEAELPDLLRVLMTTFGEEVKPEMLEDERLVCEYDRMIGVADNGQLVASAGAYSFRLTVPGLSSVGAAGVTWVAVLPTHRRRGILRQMMANLLDDAAAREEPVAVLTASEAVIYGRFGFGVGAQHARATVRTQRSSFVHTLGSSGARQGSIRLAWTGDESAVAAMAEVYERWRRTRAGALSRHEGWWEMTRRDHAYRQDDHGPAYYAIHDDGAGVVDGYVMYRLKEDPVEHQLHALVIELIALDPDIETELWRYVLDLDLTSKVVARSLPVDDPLKWRLADPRALTVDHVEDWLWVRILDVPAALEARAYDTTGRLVIEVIDDFRPDGRASGTFRFDASPGGATCERVDRADPDLTIGVESLGSAWLGAASMTTLAHAGRAQGDEDALELADALFATRPAPFCNHDF
ncbi:MAG: GNAT family N-acetyltransferase [Acidimicrobiales bacterium]